MYNKRLVKIKFEGKEYQTTQDAYVCDDGDNTDYRAHAVDCDGNDFLIIWEINHPDFENLEDESEACDWENPVDVIEF